MPRGTAAPDMRLDNPAVGTRMCSGALSSPTQTKVFTLPQMKLEVLGAREMGRLSIVFLIVTGLALTAYFGAAAWRLSDDSHLDVTGLEFLQTN